MSAGLLASLGALIGGLIGGGVIMLFAVPISDGMEWIMDRLGL